MVDLCWSFVSYAYQGSSFDTVLFDLPSLSVGGGVTGHIILHPLSSIINCCQCLQDKSWSGVFALVDRSLVCIWQLQWSWAGQGAGCIHVHLILTGSCRNLPHLKPISWSPAWVTESPEFSWQSILWITVLRLSFILIVISNITSVLWQDVYSVKSNPAAVGVKMFHYSGYIRLCHEHLFINH